MLESFENYLKDFDMQNEKIKHKYNHSIDVMNTCIKYADILKLNEQDKELVKLIGLLHDFGRFKQLEMFGSYFDNINMDHADYSVVVLFEEGYIKNFWDNEEDYEVIKYAIKNHNKKEIEKTNDARKIFFAKYIRDMDKLSIIKYFVNLIEEEMTNDAISKEVEEDIVNHKIVDYKNVKNTNDEWAAMLAYINDVNFEEVYEELSVIYKENLPKFNDKFKKVVNTIQKQIESRN